MINLFLSKFPSDFSENDASPRERISFLEELEPIIWSVITSGGRYEPRLWLCRTISNIRHVDPSDQLKLFVGILESAPSRKELAAQILRMIFDQRPAKAGGLLARNCYLLEKFFQGHPVRIMQWFDHFASTPDFGHKRGARAMSQYAFTNRDICWEDLEWKGKHGQSPAVVATKPHYFHDLNVLKTVENFLEHVPEFWTSEELAESVKDGAILRIDPQFFIDQFIRLMYHEDKDDIWDMIEDFISKEKFSILCNHLLILLGEDDLHSFLVSLSKLQNFRVIDDFRHPSAWIESLLSLSELEDITIKNLLLLNTFIKEGRQIIRLLGDEEHELELQKIEDLLKKNLGYSDVMHWSLMKECTKVDLLKAIKWVGLESWIIHFVLSKECKNQEYCESLFIKNKIEFRRYGEYSFIPACSATDGSSSDSEDEKHRRKRSRKKGKRKRQAFKESDEDESLGFGESKENFIAGNGIWLLSTDGFSSPWNMKDIPEHLSRHCFSLWMKWAYPRYAS